MTEEEAAEEISGALIRAQQTGAAIAALCARGTVTDAVRLADGDALPAATALACLDIIANLHEENGGDVEQLMPWLDQLLTRRATLTADLSD